MFLSFIIPIYNCEKYICECLDSCLEQNINASDYEIICINDGSTDNSSKILEYYAQKHTNIFLINKSNGGVSIARNKGIEASKGDYIWFLDADDFIQENILADLKSIANRDSSDRIKVQSFTFFSQLDEVQKAGSTGHRDGALLTAAFRVPWEAEQKRVCRAGSF